MDRSFFLRKERRMANPRPRHEARKYVAAAAMKTGKTHRISERAGENGWIIVYAVNNDDTPFLGEDGKPIECSYRKCAAASEYL